MAYRQPTGLRKADSRSVPETKPDIQYLRYYMMLSGDYDVLNLHIGHVQSWIMLSMSVSHVAASSAWLDCIQPYLVHCMQTVRRLAAETFAQQTFVCSHGVKRQPGKGKNNSRMFFLSIFGLVCLCIRLGGV